MDDFRRLRARAAEPRAEPPEDGPGGAAAFVGQIYNGGSIPSSVPSFFLTHPTTILGSEVEGGAPTITVDSGTPVPVFCLGPRVPVAGDRLLARWSDWRWTSGTGAPSGIYITLPGCLCTTIPPTFYMHSSDHVFGGGMFQDATITYGPTPAAYASLSLGASSFLSTASFTDVHGDTYQYFLDCNVSNFRLTRVYMSSIFGSPYKDSILYTWSFGATGNTCSPWSLTNGVIGTGLGGPVTVILNTTP